MKYHIRWLHLVILLTSLLLPAHAFAETTITGKVVGVSDGDTITVLQDRTQYKIRLYGIDTPERRQDFGTRAKQFTSDLVFGKAVTVIQKDIDRYGRVVGIVYVGETCVNEQIIESGYAWVYRKYCDEKICRDWLYLEEKAKIKNLGLWSHSDPVPPWEFRRGQRNESTKTNAPGNDPSGTSYHGNTNSHVFHQQGCKHYNCNNCTVNFITREEAVAAGYRSCSSCEP